METRAAKSERSTDWFSPLDAAEKNDEFIAVESKTFIQEAWKRFVQNKRAVFGLLVLTFFILLAITGPLIRPFGYADQDPSNLNKMPGLAHWLGTDRLGRDVFVRLCYGARISLFVGFGSSMINLMTGVLFGGLCGYLVIVNK